MELPRELKERGGHAMKGFSALIERMAGQKNQASTSSPREGKQGKDIVWAYGETVRKARVAVRASWPPALV